MGAGTCITFELCGDMHQVGCCCQWFSGWIYLYPQYPFRKIYPLSSHCQRSARVVCREWHSRKEASNSYGWVLCSSFCDGSLHVLSINGQQLCSTRLGEQLNEMIICQKSQTLITGGEMGSVRIWNFHDLSLQCTVDVKKHGAITSLVLTQSESQFLCTGSSNGMLSVVSRKNDAIANQLFFASST